MVKSHRRIIHHKKHRGGEGEITDNNSILNMDEAPTASLGPASLGPASLAASASAAMPASATSLATAVPEEEKKGWLSGLTSLFGGSRKKHVRFKMTRKYRRSSKRSSSKSSSKRSGSKQSSRKRKRSSSTKRSGSKRSSRSKRSSTKRSGSK